MTYNVNISTEYSGFWFVIKEPTTFVGYNERQCRTNAKDFIEGSHSQTGEAMDGLLASLSDVGKSYDLGISLINSSTDAVEFEETAVLTINPNTISFVASNNVGTVADFNQLIEADWMGSNIPLHQFLSPFLDNALACNNYSLRLTYEEV